MSGLVLNNLISVVPGYTNVCTAPIRRTEEERRRASTVDDGRRALQTVVLHLSTNIEAWFAPSTEGSCAG
jgi:hypothetical protein